MRIDCERYDPRKFSTYKFPSTCTLNIVHWTSTCTLQSIFILTKVFHHIIKIEGEKGAMEKQENYRKVFPQFIKKKSEQDGKREKVMSTSSLCISWQNGMEKSLMKSFIMEIEIFFECFLFVAPVCRKSTNDTNWKILFWKRMTVDEHNGYS